MPNLKFFDVKRKKGFTSDKFIIKSKRNPKTGRMSYFAVTTAPSGIASWRIVSKELAMRNK